MPQKDQPSDIVQHASYENPLYGPGSFAYTQHLPQYCHSNGMLPEGLHVHPSCGNRPEGSCHGNPQGQDGKSIPSDKCRSSGYGFHLSGNSVHGTVGEPEQCCRKGGILADKIGHMGYRAFRGLQSLGYAEIGFRKGHKLHFHFHKPFQRKAFILSDMGARKNLGNEKTLRFPRGREIRLCCQPPGGFPHSHAIDLVHSRRLGKRSSEEFTYATAGFLQNLRIFQASSLFFETRSRRIRHENLGNPPNLETHDIFRRQTRPPRQNESTVRGDQIGGQSHARFQVRNRKSFHTAPPKRLFRYLLKAR